MKYGVMKRVTTPLNRREMTIPTKKYEVDPTYLLLDVAASLVMRP
jgi:hypothetical protein